MIYFFIELYVFLDLSKITMVVEPGVLERSKALDPKKFDVL